jgi:hypothetical protein
VAPEKTIARGYPQLYSDQSIETAILTRQVSLLELRQTKGFANSSARTMSAATWIYHRIAERIRAHALVSILTLAVCRVMRQRLKLAKNDLSSERSLATLRKSSAIVCTSSRQSLKQAF